MSLIYKALEKAEKQDKKEENLLPQKNAQKDIFPLARPNKIRFLVWGFLALAVSVTAVVYFFNNPKIADSVAPPVADVVIVEKAEAPNEEKHEVSEKPAIPAEETAKKTVEEPETIQQPENVTADQPAPEITLSGIISDSDSSLAIINGKVMAVGDAISEETKIIKIDKDSVTVESQGKEFVIRK